MVEESSPRPGLGPIRRSKMERQEEIFEEQKENLKQTLLNDREIDASMVDEVIESMRALLIQAGLGQISLLEARTKRDLIKDFSPRAQQNLARKERRLSEYIHQIVVFDFDLVKADEVIGNLEDEISELERRLESGSDSGLRPLGLPDLPITMPGSVPPELQKTEERYSEEAREAVQNPAQIILDKFFPVRGQGA